MEKMPITSETVSKVGLVIDVAVLVAHGVKKMVQVFRRKKRAGKKGKKNTDSIVVTKQVS